MVNENNLSKKMESLPAKKIQALKLKISGFSNSEIGERIGKDRATIWRWETKDDNFKDVLDELKSIRTGDFITFLQRIYDSDVLAKTLEQTINEHTDQEIIEALTDLN